jgi:SAM-dependent methyltransferase
MHPEAYSFVATHLAQHPVMGLDVVEIGSFNVNGSVRSLCLAARSYVGVDVRAGPDVDLVCDGAALPADLTADVVLCCEVLEHAPAAHAICAEAFRVLRPCGRFIVTCASDPRAPHGVMGGAIGHEFYRNVPPADLRHWLKRFASIELAWHRDRGDLYAIARVAA